MRTTSLIANKTVDREGQHEKIINGLSKIKQGTFREIAEASGLNENQVCKRLSELERKGSIVYTKELKICEISGRACGIWKLL